MNEDFQKGLSKCVRCGKCRAVCPVFLVTLHEGDVARGRINAVQELDRDPTAKYLDSLSRCLLCGACSDKCPSDVPVAELTRTVRSLHNISLAKRFVHRKIFTDQRRLSKASSVAKTVMKWMSVNVPAGSGLRLRAGLEKWFGPRAYPKPPVSDLITERGTREQKSDTAYFAGCVTNYLSPEIGDATLNILKAQGVDVDLPAGQACCGLMSHGAGDVQGARKAAQSFIDVFKNYRKIIVSCASCLNMLKSHLPGLDSRGEKTSAKIVDVHGYLSGREFTINSEAGRELFPVAYHAPCHSRFENGGDQTLQLLQSIPGISMAELPDDCCGFGGSFTIAHPELSRAIAGKRARQIMDSGAKTVVTPCSGCLLGIYDVVSGLAQKPQVMHPMVLLGQLLKEVKE